MMTRRISLVLLVALAFIASMVAVSVPDALPAAATGNTGTQWDFGSATVAGPYHNIAINQWHGFAVIHGGQYCSQDWQYGNYGGAGFGRLDPKAAFNPVPVDCLTSTSMSIVVLQSGTARTIPAGNGMCTWSNGSTFLSGCIILPEEHAGQNDGDMWIQKTGPSTIVSITLKGCTPDGYCEKQTFDPFPG